MNHQSRIAIFGALAAKYEAAGMDRVKAVDRAFYAVQHGEPEPSARCGNLYDHRYPCVG